MWEIFNSEWRIDYRRWNSKETRCEWEENVYSFRPYRSYQILFFTIFFTIFFIIFSPRISFIFFPLSRNHFLLFVRRPGGHDALVRSQSTYEQIFLLFPLLFPLFFPAFSLPFFWSILIFFCVLSLPIIFFIFFLFFLFFLSLLNCYEPLIYPL